MPPHGCLPRFMKRKKASLYHRRSANGGGTLPRGDKGSTLPPLFTEESRMELASALECCICFDYILPPIQQCKRGHLVCSTCQPLITTCPMCDEPVGQIRNLAMEKLVATVMFPCKYASLGCASRHLPREKQNHENKCEYRPCSCPYPGKQCSWTGPLDQVFKHLISAHKAAPPQEGPLVKCLAHGIENSPSNCWVMLFSSFHHPFMLILRKEYPSEECHSYLAYVKLVGAQKKADKFVCKLELKKLWRKLKWRSTPCSIQTEKLEECEYFRFDNKVIKRFARDNILEIKVKVSFNDSRTSVIDGSNTKS